MKEKFSVLIPYFEMEVSLSRVLHALREHGDWIEEILVLCDGCPPPNIEIEVENCRFLEFQENQGLSWARNELLNACKGENVLFLDADAIPQTPFFEIIEKEWNGVSFFAGREIASPGEGNANRYRSLYLVQTLGKDSLDEVPYFMGLCFGGPRRFFMELGGFHEGFRTHGEDLEFSFRARNRGYKVQYLSSLSVFHDRNDDPESLRKMIRNHSRFQVFAHLCHGFSIINIMWQALKWIPVTGISSLKMFWSPGFSASCVAYSAYALSIRLIAIWEFWEKPYERIESGHLLGSQHQGLSNKKP
ncbi:glycosyltransferase [bacterium]|jgi:glycosyltransferase involved in cell wall biosynthesis|nr:glycosyltransferase [bacterium]